MRNRQRGFTLIELVFVVAIVAIVTAILIPRAIGRFERKDADTPAAPAMEVAPPTAVALGADGRSGRPARIESADIRVDLDATPVLDGLRASMRYWAAVEATFAIRNDDPDARTLRLAIPFPAGMTEARDVALRVRSPSGTLAEPEGVTYGPTAITWLTPSAPGERFIVVATYTARGSGSFAYDVTSGGRTGALRVEVRHPGIEPAIGALSLEPTESSPGVTTWTLDHVVGQRGIALDLPPGLSPLGRILLMCQLAGGAVLLFGIGFWYLSEAAQPGRLDTFRWGHFLLFALNHVAFFAIFAVLALRAPAPLAIAVATVVSQTLLVLHASRTISTSFALLRVLPLSLFTLALATGTVYASDQRSLVVAAAAIVVVGYTTLTYRRWSAGRDAHRREQRSRAARAQGERVRGEAIAELERVHGDAIEAKLAADAVLGVAGDAHPVLAGHMRTTTGVLAVELAAIDLAALRADPASDDLRLRALRRTTDQLRSATDAAAQATRAFSELVHAAELRASVERERGPVAHCIACGAPGDAAAAHCPRCGVARPIACACGRCGRTAELPQHFMRRAALRAPLHCVACGDVLPARRSA